MLPVEVLEAAREDLLNWRGSGMSVMEMSHRGKEFSQIIEEAEADLRTLLAIPANYRVLFLQARITCSLCALISPKRSAGRPGRLVRALLIGQGAGFSCRSAVKGVQACAGGQSLLLSCMCR